jgi:AraC family transcriptional regulator, regulatory protein of adaptative response / methylated-DNA-[protein]-cysteine methyltransferase
VTRALNPARRGALLADALTILQQRGADDAALDRLADSAGFAPEALRRLFTQWAGVAPERFVAFLAPDHIARQLTAPTPDAPAPPAMETLSPADAKTLGERLVIRWGWHDSPFGRALLATSERGLCWLGFATAEDGRDGLAELAAFWPDARRIADDGATRPLAERVFGLSPDASDEPIRLLLKGTDFQIAVWRALTRIPIGAVASYESLAQAVGAPAARRAVGAAGGRNPLCLLVPCHRAIQKSGIIHRYRYGVPRKRALLAWEQGKRERAAAMTEPPP